MKGKKTKDELEDFGRFSEPAVLILISLADGPKHGYAITADVEEVAGFRPGPGTLYGAIARLEARGLIEALASRGRRHPYRITARGVTALKARLAALEAVARAGQARLARGRDTGAA
jgi:DNA-binding PadR family transcriptional regulator